MLYYKAPYKLVRVKTKNKRMIWYIRFDDPVTGKVVSKSTVFADKDKAESLYQWTEKGKQHFRTVKEK